MTTVFLWSAPRSRSTAVFRSMLERGDLLGLHEPLEGLVFIGPVDVDGRTFHTTSDLIDWLLDGTNPNVFVKETIHRPVLDLVLADRRLLTEATHTFLIRRPEEIAVSWYALEGDMRIQETGVEALHQLFQAVRTVAGDPPVVIDAEDLVNDPAATMKAYCDAIGLRFLDHALSWEAGPRPEWERTTRWHIDTDASTGFSAPERASRRHLASHPDIIRFVERHQPFYERLRRHRIGTHNERAHG